MRKINDVYFDCSKWDANGTNFVGMTGVMFDSAIDEFDQEGQIVGCVAIGKIEVERALNVELAEACGVTLDVIEEEIYQ